MGVKPREFMNEEAGSVHRQADRLFKALGIDGLSAQARRAWARERGLPWTRLRYYGARAKLPLGQDLALISQAAGVSEAALRLLMGRPGHRQLDALADAAAGVDRQDPGSDLPAAPALPAPAFSTDLGSLYRGDSLEVLRALPDLGVDLVFADPPFNLRKTYPSGIDDDLAEREYLRWCEDWLEELARVLAWGGSLFLWNLPRWNALLAGVLERHLSFRHWIAVDLRASLPIPGRLYPAHYSLLYFVKGDKPRAFHPDRLPMAICPECMADLRDYGGYKSKMNPRGVNLSDIWLDLAPVRHARYKKRDGANELPLALLDRIIEMASDPGDLLLDPFGGAGTSYAAAEIKGRRWLGIEIGPVEGIRQRLLDLDTEAAQLAKRRSGLNVLFRCEHAARRRRLGLWTSASFE